MQNCLSIRKQVIALAAMSAALAHATAHATPIEKASLAPMAASSFIGVRANEIFQRDMPANTATITVKWTAPASTSTYSYYVVSLLDDTNTVRAAVLKEGAYNGSGLFTFALPPQVKDRKIRVSLYNANMVESARWDSPLFNVGEVFLVAGQSNAANSGDLSDTSVDLSADPKHRAVTPAAPGATGPSPASIWGTLTATMPFTTDTQGAPWLFFAKALSAQFTGVPVAVVNVAYGGSPIEWWQNAEVAAPERRAYTGGVYTFPRLVQGGQTLNRLSPTGASMCSFRAVLWHQGEANSDRYTTATGTSSGYGNYGPADRIYYARALKGIARDFRAKTGCAQPWMIASVSWTDWSDYYNDQLIYNPNLTPGASDKFTAESEIRTAQRYLWHRTPSGTDPVFLAGPDTDMMNGENPPLSPGYRRILPPPSSGPLRNSAIHMSTRGLKIHGQLWAWNAANLISASQPVNTVDPSLPRDLFGTAPTLPELAKVWNAYKAIGRTDAETAQDPEGLRYWVQVQVTHQGDNVASYIQSSDEQAIRSIFVSTLGRQPAFWEAGYWVVKLASPNSGVTRANLASPANAGYENTLTASQKKVFRLFVNVMGRNLDDIKFDTSGMAYWAGLLDSGATTEAAIADAFRGSDEYRVRTAFVKSLNRQPSHNELYAFMPYAKDADLQDKVWSGTTTAAPAN